MERQARDGKTGDRMKRQAGRHMERQDGRVSNFILTSCRPQRVIQDESTTWQERQTSNSGQDRQTDRQTNCHVGQLKGIRADVRSPENVELCKDFHLRA